MKTCHWRDLKLSSVELLATSPTACVCRRRPQPVVLSLFALARFLQVQDASRRSIVHVRYLFRHMCDFGVPPAHGHWWWGWASGMVCVFELVSGVGLYTSKMNFWTLYRPHQPLTILLNDWQICDQDGTNFVTRVRNRYKRCCITDHLVAGGDFMGFEAAHMHPLGAADIVCHFTPI
jgi:hypothetical protein